MSVLKFIQKLLKIKRFRVAGFSFKNRGRELWLNVKPYKNGRCCPYCNKPGKVIHTAEKPRVWLDVPVCGIRVFLVYHPREIICRRHGRVQEIIPWASAYCRVTHRFEYLLLIYCSIMTQKAAARLLRLSACSDGKRPSIPKLSGH